MFPIPILLVSPHLSSPQKLFLNSRGRRLEKIRKALWADDVLRFARSLATRSIQVKTDNKTGRTCRKYYLIQLEPLFSSGEEDNEEVFRESEEKENDSSGHSSIESRLIDTVW